MTYKASIQIFKCPKFIETTKLNSFNIKNMIYWFLHIRPSLLKYFQ